VQDQPGIQRSAPSGFTNRESDILGLIACDLSDKQVANQLGISLPTLRTHLSHVYARHGVHSRAAAVALWMVSAFQLGPGNAPSLAGIVSLDDWRRPERG
jgi:DNA-binding CsgD family transcriptional regulator